MLPFPPYPTHTACRPDQTSSLAAYGTIALGICFDIRFGPMLTAMLAREPEICAYLLPSAFNMSSGPRDWELLQRCRAVDCQIYVGMCSPARDTSVDVRPFLLQPDRTRSTAEELTL